MSLSGPEQIARAREAVNRDFRVQCIGIDDGQWYAELSAEGLVLTVIDRGHGWVLPRFRDNEPKVSARVAGVLAQIQSLMRGDG